MRGSTIAYTLAVLWAVAIFLFGLLLAALPGQAHAGCIQNWPWQQPTSAGKVQQWEHKALHFGSEAAITFAGDRIAGNDWAGPLAAGLVLVAREAQKAGTAGMRCEVSSIVFGLAGIGVGMYGNKHWFLAPAPAPGGKVALVYSAELTW